MNCMMIKLDNLNKLKSFVEACSGIDAEIEVVSGNSIANAKSMLGLMTLDLLSPLELRIAAPENQSYEIFKALSEYQI